MTMAPTAQQIVMIFDEPMVGFLQAAAKLHGLSLGDFTMMAILGATRRSLSSSSSKEAYDGFLKVSENERIRLALIPLRGSQ